MSSSPVTFVADTRFAALFLRLSCCISSLIIKRKGSEDDQALKRRVVRSLRRVSVRETWAFSRVQRVTILYSLSTSSSKRILILRSKSWVRQGFPKKTHVNHSTTDSWGNTSKYFRNLSDEQRKCRLNVGEHFWRQASLSENWTVFVHYNKKEDAVLQVMREFKQIATIAGSKHPQKWHSAHAWKWAFAVAPNPTTWRPFLWRSRY